MIRSVRYENISKLVDRLEKTFDAQGLVPFTDG